MPKVSIATDTTREAAVLAIAEKGGKSLARAPEARAGPERVWVRCAAGHEWCPQLGQLARGQWCRACSGRAPLTLAMMHETAAARGGRCLSEVYTNSTTKLHWECGRGHRWHATANNVRNCNSWCRECRGEDSASPGVARQDDPESESSESEGPEPEPEQKAQSSSSESEEAEAPSESARGAEAPPAPAPPRHRGRPPLTIEMMRELATVRGGRCTSETYKNSTTKLSWECARGHHWRAPANYVKNHNSWCERCKIATIEVVRAVLAKKYPDKTIGMPLVIPLDAAYDQSTPGFRLSFDNMGYIRIPFTMGLLEICEMLMPR